MRSSFVFGTMCSACAERDVHFVRDVSFGSDVRFSCEQRTHHFAPLAQYIIVSIANYITAACRNITLYKRPKACYNIFDTSIKR